MPGGAKQVAVLDRTIFAMIGPVLQARQRRQLGGGASSAGVLPPGPPAAAPSAAPPPSVASADRTISVP